MASSSGISPRDGQSDEQTEEVTTASSNSENQRSSRRRFLTQAAAIGLSAAALAADPGSALAQTPRSKKLKPNEQAKRPLSGANPPFLPPSDKAGVNESKLLPGSLLDETGHLRTAIPAADYEAWKAEVRKTSLERTNPARAALLHLLVGEYELAVREEPIKAGWHFRKATSLTRAENGEIGRLHGWARYNTAVALFYDSRYADAASSFRQLVNDKKQPGVDRQHVAWWAKHTAACAADHAALGKMGIPRPPSLDPICGAGGLAVCMKALKLSHDKKRLLSIVRYTGRGSSMQDLLDACPKLGLKGYSVRADEQALKALPKPLVAWVERDHFVAVMETSEKGVVYSCTDCGHWPGGRVSVTWEQWRAMKPGVYMAVAKPGSPEDKLLEKALADADKAKIGEVAGLSAPGVAFAAAGAGIGQVGAGQLALSSAYHKIVGHLVAYPFTDFTECGYAAAALQCPPGTCCPKHRPKPGAGGEGDGGGGFLDFLFGGGDGGDGMSYPYGGPADGDPVNLATGEEEYMPAPDLVVYNPNGPAVVWRRLHNTMRGASISSQNVDMGQGWSHGYNVNVYDPNGLAVPADPPPLNLVPPSSQGTVAVTGSTAPGTTGGTGAGAWEIRQGSTVVAYMVPHPMYGYPSGQPNGWSVYYNSGTNRLMVSAPSSAALGSGYEVRHTVSTGVYKSGTFSVNFTNQVPQDGSANIAKTGTDAPTTSGVDWEIVRNGTVLATSLNPNGWHARYGASFGSGSGSGLGGNAITVDAPLSAVKGTGYAVRGTYYDSSTSMTAHASGQFEVVVHRYVPQANTQKFLVFENGARIPFTPPSLPTAGTPVVRCNVPSGYGLMVHIHYDANDPAGYYVVTFADGTKWTMTRLIGVGSGYYGGTGRALYYFLAQLSDKVGNSIGFEYSGTGWGGTLTFSVKFPLLARIRDIASNTVLLTLNRSSSGWLTGVSDCYGRSVYYTVSTLPAGGTLVYNIHGLTFVSQIVPTGTGSPPMRYQYGYTAVNNGAGYEWTSMLHTITVPSPTGTGTATAKIYYRDGCYVDKLEDANGNTTEFTEVNADGTPWVDTNPPWDPQPSAPYTRVTIKDPQGNVALTYWVGYDSNMSFTVAKNSAGQTGRSETYSDPVNPLRPSSVEDGENRAWTYTWDQYGNMLTETTPRGVTVIKTWNYASFPFGQLVQVQVGSKTATTFSYHATTGLPSGFNYPKYGGGTAPRSFTWDSLGNMLTEVMPGNNAVSSNATSFSYTTDGAYTQPAKVRQALVVTNNLGFANHFRYDARGNTIQAWDALGNTVDMTYNLADQVVTTQYPATGQSGLGRSRMENIYLYVGGPLLAIKHYDEAGILIRQQNFTLGMEGETIGISGAVEAVTFSFDPLYRIKTLADGNNNITTFAYDSAGRTSSITYPGGDTIQYVSYTASGRLLSKIDARGIVSNFVYNDVEGLLTDIQYPSYPGQNVSYSYDGYGRPAGVTDGQGTETYAYDDRDMLTSKVVTYTGLPAMTIGRAYYPDGSEQTVSTPAGDFSFLYDGAGRLISQTNPYAETTQYSYLNNNWLAAQLYANGLQATFTYNALGHLIDLTNSKGATIISQYSGMTYDGFGQRLSVTATVPGMPALSGVTSYGYDSKNQLISEVSTRAGGYSNSFVFDSAGNPTIFKGGSRTYNVKNQLTGGSGLGGFTYDGEGNPTTYNGASLTFDVNNRPTSFGSLLTAGYTSFGYRAWKQDSGGTRTYYLYDNGIPIVRLSAAGAVAAVDTFGPTGLVSSRVGGISGFYAFDERGTTAERLDAAGAIMSHRASDAFGTLGGSPASGDPYDGFDGQLGYYTDSETGLTFCTNRYYDPATGRWLTRDPIKYSGGINQYSYVVNNPVFFADPTGLAAIVQLYRCYNIIIGAPVVGGPSIPFVPIEACYLQHVFIRFDKPCSIRGKLSGGSAGLYPYWHSGIPPGTGSHGGSIVYPDPGARPDPSGPGRPMHVSLVTNNDSNFETALCKCVNQSNGVWAFINNCSTWSTDMWRCAKKGAYGQGSWPFTL